jgi:hypothetical protein
MHALQGLSVTDLHGPRVSRHRTSDRIVGRRQDAFHAISQRTNHRSPRRRNRRMARLIRAAKRIRALICCIRG